MRDLAAAHKRELAEMICAVERRVTEQYPDPREPEAVVEDVNYLHGRGAAKGEVSQGKLCS